MKPALLASRGAISAHWQLGTVRGDDHFVMIGWRVSPPSVDGGVPAAVAQVMAAAFTAVASVSFLGPKSAWMTTTEADAALQLFEAPAQPWALQAQVVLFSDRTAPAPVVNAAEMTRLLSDNWKQQARSAAARGVMAVLRPGVDGDVVGLLSLDAAFERSLLGALEQQAKRAGFEWQELPEAAFSDSLADGY